MTIRRRITNVLRGAARAAKEHAQALLSEYAGQHGGGAELLKTALMDVLSHPLGPQQGVYDALGKHGSAAARHVGRSLISKATPFVTRAISKVHHAVSEFPSDRPINDPIDMRVNPGGTTGTGQMLFGNDQQGRTTLPGSQPAPVIKMLRGPDIAPDTRRHKLAHTFDMDLPGVPVGVPEPGPDFSTSFISGLGWSGNTSQKPYDDPHISNAGWYFRKVGTGTNTGPEYPLYGEHHHNIPSAEVISPALTKKSPNQPQLSSGGIYISKPRKKRTVVVPAAISPEVVTKGKSKK